MVKVLYFGVTQDITGSAYEEFEAENTTDLLWQISERHPKMSNVTFRLALNGTILISEMHLADGDKIAILPPFSGG